jgi:spermidine synthase
LKPPLRALLTPITFLAGRRRWLRVCGAGMLAGAGLGGCERVRQEVKPAPVLTVIEERQTQFGRLAVVELQRKRYLAYGPGTDIVYQSVLDLDRPLELAASYTRLMMLGVVYAEPYARILQIGVGAGNMTGYAIRNFPAAVVDAVDIDRHAVELGARHFGLAPDPRLRVHIEDGRAWLAASHAQFDVIMLDAYDDQSIPAALMDEAFFAIVAAHLAPGGVVMQNVYLPSVDRRRLLAAMRDGLPRVDVYRIGDSAVLAAYRGPERTPQQLQARALALDAALQPVHSLAGLLAFRTGPL